MTEDIIWESCVQNNENQNMKSFDLPFTTILKILLVLLFVICLKVLAPLLMTLFLASLVAVSLAPILEWLEKKGIKRSVAISLITVVLAGSVIALMALIVPLLFEQLTSFIANLPQLKQQVLGELSTDNPLRPFIAHGLDRQSVIPKPTDIAPIFSAGNAAMSGVIEIVLIFVFSIYLLIDGRGVINWISAFFKPSTQEKIQKTADEVSPIIFSYVAGQLITSFLSFLYVLVALSLLHVPSVLLLATLAGLFDVLPVLGFFIALIPALIFALPISASTAVYVFLLYVLYHILENYFIVPAIYGKRLRVSSFVVLITLISAGLLAGIEGAVAILPVVASYPIIERIWLKTVVGKAHIDEHAIQEEVQS